MSSAANGDKKLSYLSNTKSCECNIRNITNARHFCKNRSKLCKSAITKPTIRTLMTSFEKFWREKGGSRGFLDF